MNPTFEGRGQSLGKLAPVVKTALLAYLRKRRASVRQQEQNAIIATIKPILSAAVASVR